MRQKGIFNRKKHQNLKYHLLVDAKYFFQIEDLQSLVGETNLPGNLTQASATVRPSTQDRYE